MSNRCENTVVVTLHIYFEDSVEFRFGRALYIPNMRHPGVVHENVELPLLCDFLKGGKHLRLQCHIAPVSGCRAAAARDLVSHSLGLGLIHIENANCRAILRKLQRNSTSNAAGRAGDSRNFTVESKLAGYLFSQSETPRFQGMKSCWFFCSALVCTSPLATCTTRSSIFSPISSMVASPETIGPVSMSMMSGIRAASAVLVDSLMTGAIGFPVGVPSPVVNKTKLAPAPTWAVTHSTSLPGVHCRLSPGNFEYSG